MPITLRLVPALVVLACGVSACGGGTAVPAKTPEGAPSDSKSTSATGPEASTAPAPGTKDSGTAPKSSAAAEDAIKRTLADRIFAPTMAYVFNDGSSALTETRRAECEKKFPENPAAQATCREKDRAKFVADVLVFEKKDDEAIFTIYKRSGSSLVEMSKSKVSVADDTPQSVKLKVLSEKGWRAIFSGKKEITVGYDSDSSIDIQDPTYGKLVYEARIGLVNKGQEEKKK